MKSLLLAFSLLVPLHAMPGEARPVAQDPVLEQRLMSLSENLRCLVCQNESLASSPSDLAQDLREEIRAQMRKGKSDEQVIDYLTRRYGDFVLYKPPFKPLTWLLWLGPAALLAGVGGTFYCLIRRQGDRAGDEPLSDRELKRVAALLGANGSQSGVPE
jgi:cytochrome c-type biogenesis protein CcmH